MSNNTESNNSGWIFLAGLATGAAVGYLINTDKGRQIRNEATDKAMEYGTQARDFAQEKFSTVASTVTDILDKGKSYAAEVSSKLQERIKSGVETAKEKVEEKVDETENAFQRGANRAKNHLHENSANS